METGLSEASNELYNIRQVRNLNFGFVYLRFSKRQIELSQVA